MAHIRVKGIVGAAHYVHQMLSRPMTARQRDALAIRLEQSVRQIESILARNQASVRQLAAPSRRAYLYLKQVDLAGVPVVPEDAVEDPGGSMAGAETVSFTGLRGFVDCILDDLAMHVLRATLNRAATARVLRQTAERLNHTYAREGFSPEQLRPESRQLLAWFRYFSTETHFQAYVDAVQRAMRVLSGLSFAKLGWKKPVLVHFRPSRNLYRCREVEAGIRMVLPTPMILFDEGLFEAIGRQILGRRGSSTEVTVAMMSEEYQRLVGELEATVGRVEHTHGVAHDLQESFQRVNAAYFGGEMDRPRLTWSRMITGRVFGHYNFARDEVLISSALDAPEVPAYVLDHVMHHELLHKKHGLSFQGDRHCSHTAEFRREETSFKEYAQACAFLALLTR